MIQERLLSSVSDLATNPQHYALLIDEECVALGSSDLTLRIKGSCLAVELPIRRQIILIPLSEKSLSQLKGVTKGIMERQSSLFPRMELQHRHLIQSLKNRNYRLFIDIFIYDIPQGDPLRGYVASASRSIQQQLYDAIAALEDELRLCDCTFEALSPDRIVIGDDGQLYPYDMQLLRLGGGDDAYLCCDELRRWLSAESGLPLPCGVTEMFAEISKSRGYITLSHEVVDGHIWCGTLHEERIAVRDESGYGFVDPQNNYIIEPKYLSATAFREGRSVVETAGGYGLIDLWGRFVIAAEYDDMDYNSSTGVTVVKRDGLWARFNYRGEMVSPFTNSYPKEILK